MTNEEIMILINSQQEQRKAERLKEIENYAKPMPKEETLSEKANRLAEEDLREWLKE